MGLGVSCVIEVEKGAETGRGRHQKQALNWTEIKERYSALAGLAQ